VACIAHIRAHPRRRRSHPSIIKPSRKRCKLGQAIDRCQPVGGGECSGLCLEWLVSRQVILFPSCYGQRDSPAGGRPAGS
jgi:hypothetical protein